MGQQQADLAVLVDAFEHSTRSLLAVAGALDPADWDRPTDRHMEDGVAARRALPVADVVAELAGCPDDRVSAMRTMATGDPPTRVPAGEGWDTTTLLRNRAFDVWVHGQDVRRAVGRPGNLDGPGARVAQRVLDGALPYVVAKRARAMPGQGVRLVVDGPVAFDVTVVVGADGRAIATERGVEPTATVRTGWETYVRLAGGRVAAADAPAEVAGDADLAARLLGGPAVTP